MFQNRLQQFECDKCHTLIPKSQPVRFDSGKHFCNHTCHNDYLDALDDDRAWREAEERMHLHDAE